MKKILVAMMLLPLVASAKSLSDGLVAWYKFDGDIKDSSGKSNDLIGQNPRWTSDSKGHTSQAAMFIGDGYLSPDKNLYVEKNLTISVWVNPQRDIVRNGETLRRGIDSRQDQYVLYPSHGGNGNTGKAGVGLLVGKNGIAVVEHAAYHFMCLLEWFQAIGGKWTHVAVVVSQNGAPELYVNGDSVRTGLASGKGNFIGRSFSETYQVDSSAIGGGRDGLYYGAMDDLRIYNRALTADEVKMIYRGEDVETANRKLDKDETENGDEDKVVVDIGIDDVETQKGSAAMTQAEIPSQKQIDKAIKVIAELCEKDLKAAKNGKISNLELAKRFLALVKKTDNIPVKFVLLRNAYKRMIMAGAIDGADSLYDKVFAKFGACFAVEMAKSGESALALKASKSKVMVKARALQNKVAEVSKCVAAIKEAEEDLKKDPGVVEAKKKKALNCMKIGDWQTALTLYAELGGERANVALWELTEPEERSDDYNAEKVGDYWWSVIADAKENGALFRSVSRHAVYWYDKALEDGEMSEMKEELIRKRIDKTLGEKHVRLSEKKEINKEVVNDETGVVKEEVESKNQLFCIIDLSKGCNASSYRVSYLSKEPSGGWGMAYKTTKLVLKRIDQEYEAYYIGVFEVTQKQYMLVMGVNPSHFVGSDTRPVETVSYSMIRGGNKGWQYPNSIDVDEDSFLGKLRARTGLIFDLPKCAQWEHACRCGTITAYSYGDHENGDYMWYPKNAGGCTHDVGTRKPNPWGLYDMHGNAREWCLEWYPGMVRRWHRGGGISGGFYDSSSWSRGHPNDAGDDWGFRVVINLKSSY